MVLEKSQQGKENGVCLTLFGVWNRGYELIITILDKKTKSEITLCIGNQRGDFFPNMNSYTVNRHVTHHLVLLVRHDS